MTLRWRVVGWAGAALALWVLFWTDEWLQPRLHGFANRERTGAPPPVVTALFDALRTAGKWPMLLFTTIVLAELHPLGRRWAVVYAVSVGLALLAGELVWRSVSRVRPNAAMSMGTSRFLAPGLGFTGARDAPSFPSSEAAASAAGAGVLVAAVPRLAWLWLALAAGCGLMRIEAGAHFPSDVWAGSLLGWAAATAVCRFVHRWVGPEPPSEPSKSESQRV